VVSDVFWSSPNLRRVRQEIQFVGILGAQTVDTIFTAVPCPP
jgi:hypothetical protein